MQTKQLIVSFVKNHCISPCWCIVSCSKTSSYSSDSAVSCTVALQVRFLESLVSVCATAESVPRWNASCRWKL